MARQKKAIELVEYPMDVQEQVAKALFDNVYLGAMHWENVYEYGQEIQDAFMAEAELALIVIAHNMAQRIQYELDEAFHDPTLNGYALAVEALELDGDAYDRLVSLYDERILDLEYKDKA